MKTVAFINARRDSDRLPNKHMLYIEGLTLIARVTDYAASQDFNSVIVSTNCSDIQKDIRGVFNDNDAFVTVLDRPESLCQERPDIDVADECRAVNEWNIKEYQRIIGDQSPIRVAKFHGNSLILKDDLFERGIKVLEDTGAARVRSFYKFDTGHPYNCYTLDLNCVKSALGVWKRGQEFPPFYACDDGIDISYWPPRQGPLAAVITEPGDVCHIHTQRDYEIACALWEAKRHGPRRP